MNINPGELNKRIQVVAITSQKDGDGIKSNETVLIHECYAKISNASASEILKSGGVFYETNTRFLIRFTAKNINTSSRIIYNSKSYDIIYINNYAESNSYIELIGKLSEMPI